MRLQKLARGEGSRTLQPAEPELVFEQSMELEYPLTELEPLSFTLAMLLGQLKESLESRALAAIEIRLQLKLENQPVDTRAIRLPVPMRDTKTLLKLLQLELSAHPPAAPILAVMLQAEAAKPRAAQGGLYTPPAPEPEKLELTLARIAAVVGQENVGSPEMLDTHRPQGFRISDVGFRMSDVSGAQVAGTSEIRNLKSDIPSFRVYRPPLLATVQAPEGRPSQISARGVQGKVLTRAGPWRISGDWWTPTPWARDEWDIALSDGALYRIYFERPAGRWFIEGSYD